jgi:hypothetical protein
METDTVISGSFNLEELLPRACDALGQRGWVDLDRIDVAEIAVVDWRTQWKSPD